MACSHIHLQAWHILVHISLMTHPCTQLCHGMFSHTSPGMAHLCKHLQPQHVLIQIFSHGTSLHTFPVLTCSHTYFQAWHTFAHISSHNISLHISLAWHILTHMYSQKLWLKGPDLCKIEPVKSSVWWGRELPEQSPSLSGKLLTIGDHWRRVCSPWVLSLNGCPHSSGWGYTIFILTALNSFSRF